MADFLLDEVAEILSFKFYFDLMRKDSPKSFDKLKDHSINLNQALFRPFSLTCFQILTDVF